MPHIPVNHPMRPFFRTLAGLVGLYVLVFGILGVVQTWGDALFARDSTWVLGLRTNLAFAIMSVLFGTFIMIGSVTGGNLGHFISLAIGVIFLSAGLVMLAVQRTDLNLLNFSMANVIVSFLFGLLFLATGFYDKVSSPREAFTEKRFRGRHATSER
ncbi:MAG TPA: DUF4383 domain-containing protein [Micromonospora sp.]|nr:DUF4383 domain-containing protein [Micromonospora sp.]